MHSTENLDNFSDRRKMNGFNTVKNVNTSYTRPEGMCNGYPTFAKKEEGKKLHLKCRCDHSMHMLQPMRDENPHYMVIISKEEKLQNQYKNLHEQA